MKKNLIRTSVIILAGISLLLSCKKKEANDSFPRNVDFYIRYISEGNQFNSLCKISYADTLAEGEPDTANYFITLNNKDMKQIIPPSGVKHYNLKTVMANPGEYEIKIKEPDGNIISQSTRLTSIDSLQINPDVSKSKGLTISYAGKPLSASESIIVMIISDNNKSASSTIQGPTSGQNITVKPQDLALLNDGKADLYLIRTYSDEAVNGKMHFYFRNEYFTKTYKINLKP